MRSSVASLQIAVATVTGLREAQAGIVEGPGRTLAWLLVSPTGSPGPSQSRIVAVTSILCTSSSAVREGTIGWADSAAAVDKQTV